MPPTRHPKHAVFLRIAREELDIHTLTMRNSDRLDFHEVSAAGVARALAAAYDSGKRAGIAQSERARP